MNKKIIIGIIVIVIVAVIASTFILVDGDNSSRILSGDKETITTTVSSVKMYTPSQSYSTTNPDDYNLKVYGTDGSTYQYYGSHDSVQEKYDQIKDGDKIRITFHKVDQAVGHEKIIDSFTAL